QHGSDFSRGNPAHACRQKLRAQLYTPHSVSCVGVTRTALRIVPRTLFTIDQFCCRLSPGPEFDESGQPRRDVPHRDVDPDVPDLLLTRALNFFEVMKILLDRSAV